MPLGSVHTTCDAVSELLRTIGILTTSNSKALAVLPSSDGEGTTVGDRGPSSLLAGIGTNGEEIVDGAMVPASDAAEADTALVASSPILGDARLRRAALCDARGPW